MIFLITYLFSFAQAGEITSNSKVLEIYNKDLNSKSFKHKGYYVKNKLPKSKYVTNKELDKIIKKIGAQSYTKTFDSLDKQIFLHRLTNYNLEELQLYYPKIPKAQTTQFKRMLK